jgi:hypothetical protein
MRQVREAKLANVSDRLPEWYPETEPSVLKHQIALRQLLLRFWVTDHGDCHFPAREESLEKVLVLPRGAKNSVNPVNHDLVLLDLLSSWVGGPARGVQHPWAHFAKGFKLPSWGVLKMAPMAKGRHVSFNWNCYSRLYIGTLKSGCSQRSNFRRLKSISNVTFHFAPIWNPDEVHKRYVPRIYHVYSERRYIPGIYHACTMDIEILFSWIYV